jgi:hypothetical protein
MDQNLLVGVIVLALIGLAIYSYYPRMRGGLPGFEGFAGSKDASGNLLKTPGSNGDAGVSASATTGAAAKKGKHALVPAGKKDGDTFADFASYQGDSGMGSLPMAGAQRPAGCFPREQLNPSELLPSDPNSQWAQVNPTGAGDIQGKNFLSAGALIGVDSIGQSLRNANLQLRSEPPCPQVTVSPWQQSTIQPDLQRKPLDGF